jgi:hypothetical protein
MKRIILLFGLIFSLVAVKANAGETPTNEQKAHNQALGIQKLVSLSNEQTVKVEAVLLSKIVEIETITNDVTKDAAAKQSAIDAVKKNKDSELAAIMSPEQFSMFVNKRDEIKQRKDIAH